jgi:hypothetical protein
LKLINPTLTLPPEAEGDPFSPPYEGGAGEVYFYRFEIQLNPFLNSLYRVTIERVKELFGKGQREKKRMVRGLSQIRGWK